MIALLRAPGSSEAKSPSPELLLEESDEVPELSEPEPVSPELATSC
jgi:hypothetical protein